MKNFNDDEFADFAALTKDKDIDVRFIEFMPFDSNAWSKDKFIPQTEIKEQIEKRFPNLVRVADTDGKSSTQRSY